MMLTSANSTGLDFDQDIVVTELVVLLVVVSFRFASIEWFIYLGERNSNDTVFFWLGVSARQVVSIVTTAK